MDKQFEENVYSFISEVRKFEYTIESIDLIWDVIFPHKKTRQTTYFHIRVTKYKDTYYIAQMDGDLCTLEVQLNTSVKAAESFGSSRHNGDFAKKWDGLISSARNWLKVVKKDWIKANREIWTSYPLNRRYGIVCSSLVRDLIKDIYRIDQELGKGKLKKFIKLVEQGDIGNDYDPSATTMTANDFFSYCKIAYIAGKRKEDFVDESLSGREMYKRYADGRDEGLLEIDENSPEEFADWIDDKHPKKATGGHPWEIKRGGNTTHINLSVSRPRFNKEGFIVQLCGRSFTRLKETICMFLAVHDMVVPKN